jgi:hypothetical protein
LKFVEIDLLGIYVAPISVLMVAACYDRARRVASRFGLLGNV